MSHEQHDNISPNVYSGIFHGEYMPPLPRSSCPQIQFRTLTPTSPSYVSHIVGSSQYPALS